MYRKQTQGGHGISLSDPQTSRTPAAARARPTPAGRKGSDSFGWQQNEYVESWLNNADTVPFCCSQLGAASAAKSNHPTTSLPTYLTPPGKPSAGLRGRARAARRGGAEAGALHPARGRHRLAPQLTALRPLRRRAAGVAQKATPGVGCSLDPSPAAPSPGRLTAHGALGC